MAKKAPPTRDQYINIPVSESERSAIDRAAAHDGLKRATWGRLKLLQAAASVDPGRRRRVVEGGKKSELDIEGVKVEVDQS